MRSVCARCLVAMILFCCAVSLFGCADDKLEQSPPPVVDAVPYVRFDDRLGEATERSIARNENAGDAARRLEFVADSAPWIAGNASTQLGFADGNMIVETRAADTVSSPGGLKIDGPTTDSVSIRMRVSGADGIRIWWAAEGFRWEWLDDRSSYEITVLEQDTWHTYRMATTDKTGWGAHTMNALRFAIPANARVEVDWIEITSKQGRFSAEGAGVAHHRTGREERQGLFINCDGALSYELTLPEEAVFKTGWTVLDTRVPVRFSLDVIADGDTARVLEATLDNASEWRDVRADLSAWAGRQVSLVLQSEIAETDSGKTPVNVGFWSNPLLYDPHAPSEPLEAMAELPAVRANVVVYLVDCLRADYLGAYGHEGDISPAMDAFAEEGARFERFFAQNTWTKPSVSTLFTSLSQWAHGVVQHGNVIPPKAVSMASVFRKHGYATGTVTSSAFGPPDAELGRGFSMTVRARHATDSQDESLRKTETIANRLALTRRFLEQHRDQPFFLYVHTLEPHKPYTAPAEYVTQFDEGDAADPYAAGRAQYEAEVRRADAGFNEFLHMLDELQLSKRTLIVLLADHGEAQGEHGEQGHVGSPYNHQIHVPLLMRLPGYIRAGTVVDANAMMPDLAPTLLGLVGLPVPEVFSGISLSPLLQGQELPALQDRMIFATGKSYVAAINGDWKLMMSHRVPTKLFDLASDPKELVDLAGTHPDRVAEMTAAIETYIAAQNALAESLRGDGAAETEAALDVETLERMEALGYIE